MNFQKLEDDIVARLEPLKALAFEVVPLPENDADASRPFQFGRVTVAYKGSLFNDDGFNGAPKIMSTAEIVQKETAEIEIVIQARLLRGANGIHNLTQLVRKRLMGFRPRDWNRLYGREHRFVEHADGIWTYALTLFCNALSVEHVDPVTLPILSQVTVFLGDDEATVITVNSDNAPVSTDPTGTPYVFQTGVSFSLKYEFLSPTNLPVDLTGYTFRWAIKQYISDVTPLHLKTPTPMANVVYGTLTNVENTLVPGTYKAILEVINDQLVVEQEIVNTIVITPQNL